MAGRSATLAIRIVSDASQAGRGFAEAESRTAGFQRNLDRASVAAGGVLLVVGRLAQEAGAAASNLEQSSGAVETVYGAQAAAVKAYAADAAEANGLAARAYQESAALIGSQLKTLGYPMGTVVDQTDGLIDRASDLAATFGGSTESAVAALSSALKGERDPIERYGISLSQAAVDAKVAALGLDTSTEAAKRNAGAQATLALITEQSASAQGAFAREGDTAAGAQARATASWENAQAALGQALLPVMTEAATTLSELAGWLVANQEVVIPLIGAVAGLATGIIALNAGMRAYATVQAVVNAVMNASPLMRMVLIITAIIAVVIALVNHFGGFEAVAEKVGNALLWAFEKAKSAISWVLDKLKWLVAHSPAGILASLFTAPASAAAGSPAAAGLYGSANGMAAGLYGASASPLAVSSAGRSSSGQDSTPAGTVINVTIQGALDPVAVGRQVDRVARRYGRAVGARTTAYGGRA